MAVSPSLSQQPASHKTYTPHTLQTTKNGNGDHSNIAISSQQKRLASFKSLSSLKDTASPSQHSSMSSPYNSQTSSTSQSGGKKIKQFFQKIGKKNTTNAGTSPSLLKADNAVASVQPSGGLSETGNRGKANRGGERDISLISEQSWGPGPGSSPDPSAGIPLLEQAEHDYHHQTNSEHLGENGISQQHLYIPETPTSPRFTRPAEHGDLDQIQEEQFGDRSSEIACTSPISESAESGIQHQSNPATPVADANVGEANDVARLPLTPVSTQFPSHSDHSVNSSPHTAASLADKPLPSRPRSNTGRSFSSPLVLATTPSTVGNPSLDQPSIISNFGQASTRSHRLNSYSNSTDQASSRSGSLAAHYTVQHQSSLISDHPGQETARGPQYISALSGPTQSSTSLKTRLFALSGKQQATTSSESVISAAQKKVNKSDKFKTLGRLGHPANGNIKAKRNPTAPALTVPTEGEPSPYAPSPVAHEPLRASPTEEKTTFARRLIRRVASAPNAKGLFTASGGTLGGSGLFSVGSGNTTQVDTSPSMTPTGYISPSGQLDPPNLSKLEISDESEGDRQLSQSPRNLFAPFSRKQTSPSTYSPKPMSSQTSLPKSPVMSSPYLAASTSTLGSTSTGAQASGRGTGAMGAREGRANSVGVLQHKGSNGNLLGINGVPIGNGKPVRPNALSPDQGKGSFRRTYSSNSIRTKSVSPAVSSSGRSTDIYAITGRGAAFLLPEGQTVGQR